MSRTNKEYQELVEDLCNLTEGLTNWECDFVSSMLDWEGEYTENQKTTIEKIYDKAM